MMSVMITSSEDSHFATPKPYPQAFLYGPGTQLLGTRACGSIGILVQALGKNTTV